MDFRMALACFFIYFVLALFLLECLCRARSLEGYRNQPKQAAAQATEASNDYRILGRQQAH